MSSEKILGTALISILVFVLFQKVNQFLCALMRIVIMRNELLNSETLIVGLSIAGVVSLTTLILFYKVFLNGTNEELWKFVVLPLALLIMLGVNTVINWATGNYLAMDANESDIELMNSLWSYAHTQVWIVEVTAGVIFIVKLLNEKSS